MTQGFGTLNCIAVTCVFAHDEDIFFWNGHLLCSIDPNERHDPDSQNTSMAADIVIGDYVWLGGNVTILPGVQIGEGCVIGAGSVVTKV